LHREMDFWFNQGRYDQTDDVHFDFA